MKSCKTCGHGTSAYCNRCNDDLNQWIKKMPVKKPKPPQKEKLPPWRPPKFSTPDALWAAFESYVEWTNNNPIIVIDYRGKDAERVELPHKRPLTVHGFQAHVNGGIRWWSEFKDESKTAQGDNFSEVIRMIDNAIYRDKFDGATVGTYKENIIARDLGLTDKSQVDHGLTDIAANVVSKFPFKIQDAGSDLQ